MPDDTSTEPADLGFGRPEPTPGLNAVDAAITTRRAVRAFRPDPVPDALVRHILAVAARAPSGTNTQPWHAHVLTGAAKERLTQAVLAAREGKPEGTAEYRYYPRKWAEPYLSRRRRIGWDLYGLLGIEKGDRERTWAQFGRNYLFFDAPVGMVFTIDRDLETGSWLDYGMFLQNIMISARGHGLDTCPQAAWMEYPDTVSQVLGIPEEQMVVCGMSLGYADNDKIESQLVTAREPVEGFATWHDG
ncbi:MAG: nitroreductase [Alphaproteobacteria bacterium]|nr:nitroreductase [Alphaproteobacteria bacterium]